VRESGAYGIMLILIAGFLQGTFMLPIKYARQWEWENTWLGFSISGYVGFPWLVAFLTVPHLHQVFVNTSNTPLAWTFLWGLGWGLGGLLFGLGVNYVGLALGFAIVIGLTAAIGTLIPLLLVSHVDLASTQGTFIVAGVVVTLFGIALCSWAGKLRENVSAKSRNTSDGPPKRSFGLGVLLCVLSGVLCPCGNLGFAFGSEMTAMATKWGTAPQYASTLLWALLALPPFICNGAFCVYLLLRKQTSTRFLLPGTKRNFLLATSMGAMWLGGMILYGMGANVLGAMGSSIGWAIVMSLMVLVANLWGLLAGEWRGVSRKPLWMMSAGLAVLVAAMFMVGLRIR